jgi:hypothetical protein
MTIKKPTKLTFIILVHDQTDNVHVANSSIKEAMFYFDLFYKDKSEQVTDT